MKPNVVWIYGEDLYPDLACYGTPVVETPVLDQFASEGTMFTNAFVTCPVCSPSRSAIITGRYQTSFGAHNHRSKRDEPLDEDIRLVTDYFRDAGYFTCNSSGPPPDKPGKTDFNFQRENPFDGVLWSERENDQPFYAQFNITDTHRDFSPDPVNPIDPDEVEIPPYYPDHPLIRKDWAMWLESIQVFDRKVGEVLQRLDDDGLTDNTMVFIISDHGRAHIRDKQFLYDGGMRVPCIVHWPGRIDAGVVSDSMVSGIDFAPTSLSLAGLDVPEVFEGNVFLGADAKKREHVVSARDRCDGTVDRIRCVRTKTHKYIRNYYPDRPYMQFNGYKKQQYPMWTLAPLLKAQGKLNEAQEKFLAPCRPYEELYDLASDPYELNNLAADDSSAGILADLSSRLDKWAEKYGDEGEVPESPRAIAEESQKMQNSHVDRMASKGLKPDVSDEDFIVWWEADLLGEDKR
ncbi:MAG: sulfatase [Candidatus Latescibacterota bacterium]|nr:sulfatase [Candidatus Latescibacterota bacterium]